MEKYHKKWKKLARHQAKFLFTTDASYIKDAAQILSDVYDLDKLDRIEAKKCLVCQEASKKRCSKCKEAWYCSRYVENISKIYQIILDIRKSIDNFFSYRECQVKDWENHKNICNIISTKNSTDNTDA